MSKAVMKECRNLWNIIKCKIKIWDYNCGIMSFLELDEAFSGWLTMELVTWKLVYDDDGIKT